MGFILTKLHMICVPAKRCELICSFFRSFYCANVRKL